MSSRTNHGRKAVRFAEAAASSDGPSVNGNHHQEEDEEDALLVSRTRNPKRKRRDPRPNEDELDDIDEYNETEDGDYDDNHIVPSSHDLLQAKQKRRILRQVGKSGIDGEVEDEDDPQDQHQQVTRIDNRTSLAAEGIEIEPFSMDPDRNDGMGYFEGDTFVFRKRGADDEPDAWVEGLDNNNNDDDEEGEHGNDHKYIRKPSTTKFVVKNEDNNDEPKDRLDDWREEDLYAKILPNLVLDDETVLQAIVRYGNIINQSKQNKSDISSDDDKNNRQLAQDSLNDLTEAANALLMKGKINIYQQTKQDIAKLVPLPAPAANTSPEVQWEYRGNEDGQIHGLYSTQEMLAWIRAGYFVGPSAVQVRTVSRVTSTNKMTISIQQDLMADLMEDDSYYDTTDKQESTTVHGEWTLSDAVDFTKYL